MTAGRSRESGVALLVTLLVLVLVVTAALEIFRVGARAARTGAYGRDSIRASLLAEAGTAVAGALLKQDLKDNANDSLGDLWARPLGSIELGDGIVTAAIEDEERKIDLNRLVLTNGNAPDETRVAIFRLLLERLALDPSLADAVVDWLDNDEIPRVGGAESSYYSGLPHPYKTKNDKFDTVEELRLVRGVTPEVFAKLRPFVTVDSTGLVNINTAPKEVLMALSAGDHARTVGEIDEAAADRIIEYRKETPFAAKADVKNVGPPLRDLYDRTTWEDLIDVRSTHFHVRATGDAGGTVRTVDAVGVRSGNAIQWRCWRLE